MQKVQPAKNSLDMDFLNSMNKPIGGTAVQQPATVSTPVAPVVEKEPETVIDPIGMSTDFDTEIDIEDDVAEEAESPVSVSRQIKATQIVVRTTEKEREALKSYFMKHGVSLSKGIKIAIKYLEQQEKKGLVHFSDIGLY
jgi:hypothetical protein